MLDFITEAFKSIVGFIKENFCTAYIAGTMGPFLGNLFLEWQKKRKEKKQEPKDQ